MIALNVFLVGSREWGFNMKKGLAYFCFLSLGMLIGTIFGWKWTRGKMSKVLRDKKDSNDKMTEFYWTLVRWNRMLQNGHSINEWLERNGIKTVAIYGMKEMGELLYAELKDTNITVKYGIDRDNEKILSEINIIPPEMVGDDVDAVIVTAIHSYDVIEQYLVARQIKRIYSLEDILYQLDL